MYRDSVGITDIMVEDISFAGTPWDKGYLFDFSQFDPCYSNTTMSATAASDGGPVGVRFLCDYTSPTSERAYNPDLNLTSAPNPASGSTQLSFHLQQGGQINLSVFDLNGRLVSTLFNGTLPAGSHTASWENLDNISKGMYFANLQTAQGRMFVKIFVQ